MRDFLKAFGISFLVFGLILGFGAKVYINNFFDDITEAGTRVIIPQKPDDDNEIEYPSDPVANVRYNFLILGVDEARADTIMVASFNIESLELDLISVPRDTYHYRPGYDYPSQKKINASFAIAGTDQTRSQATAQAVSNLLNIPIHYYVRLDYEAVKRIVDNIGGITLHIAEDMYYEDLYQDLIIDIKAGTQRLNGEKAMHFLRYRSYAEADIARIRAQHYFMIEMAKQALSLGNVVSTVETLASYVATNMSSSDIKRFSMLALDFNPNKIYTHTVPGSLETLFGLSFVINDYQGTKALIESIYAKDDQ